MACRFAKVLEEEIEEASFYPSDLLNTKTTIPLRVGEERRIYTSTLCVSVYIHHYSPLFRGIVACHSFVAIQVKVTEKLPKVYFWTKISDHESNNHSYLLSNNIVGVKCWLNLTVVLTLDEIAEREI